MDSNASYAMIHNLYSISWPDNAHIAHKINNLIQI